MTESKGQVSFNEVEADTTEMAYFIEQVSQFCALDTFVMGLKQIKPKKQNDQFTQLLQIEKAFMVNDVKKPLNKCSPSIRLFVHASEQHLKGIIRATPIDEMGTIKINKQLNKCFDATTKPQAQQVAVLKVEQSYADKFSSDLQLIEDIQKLASYGEHLCVEALFIATLQSLEVPFAESLKSVPGGNFSQSQLLQLLSEFGTVPAVQNEKLATLQKLEQ